MLELTIDVVSCRYNMVTIIAISPGGDASP